MLMTMVFLGLPVASFAQTPSVTSAIGSLRDQIKNERKEIAEQRKDIREEIKNNKPAWLVDAIVASKSDSSFTVTKDGKTYTVNVLSSTKFRRHFWGESSFSELAINNHVNIWGKWTDTAHTAIDARLVRNTSVQKIRGVFFGTMKSKSSNSFVINSIYRGDQTVNFDSNTKFVNRKEQTMNFSDIQTGDRIRVKGVWDKSSGTISEVTQVKDYSNPAIVTPTPTP